MFRRRFADLLLFCVTATELVILFLLTPTFTITDWIYVLQHFIVLGIALTRPRPKVWDYSVASSVAVGIAYVYPYAQVIYLRWSPGHEAWPAAGLVLVATAATALLGGGAGSSSAAPGANQPAARVAAHVPQQAQPDPK